MQFKAQFSFYIRKMLHNFSGVRRFLLFTRSTSFQLHLRVLQRRPERRSNLWGLPEGRQAVQELRLQDGWNAALQQTQHHHHGGPLRVLAQRQPSIFALRERWTLKPPQDRCGPPRAAGRLIHTHVMMVVSSCRKEVSASSSRWVMPLSGGWRYCAASGLGRSRRRFSW